MIHGFGTVWRIKNQPSNSTSCSDTDVRLLVFVVGRLYCGLEVTASFSIWGCILKGQITFLRALKPSILNIAWSLLDTLNGVHNVFNWSLYYKWHPNNDLDRTSENSAPLQWLIPSPHLLVLATSKRFLPARGTFRAILAGESHWLQAVLILSVHWWPAPASVGRILVMCSALGRFLG